MSTIKMFLHRANFLYIIIFTEILNLEDDEGC